jgi:hypothetical protein
MERIAHRTPRIEIAFVTLDAVEPMAERDDP